MSLQIDNEREWVQWWIEDEEWLQFIEQWQREQIPSFLKIVDSTATETA